jgi:16S rRNA (guanine1516-N2)-methyltransferase
VLYYRPEQTEQAAFYGSWCRLEPAQSAPVVSEAGLYLDHAGLWLCMPGYAQPYRPSNADLLRRASRGGSRTELARACGSNLTGLDVLDACAGYGSDGLLLAQLGAQVCLVERDRLIWMLLHDRAQHIPRTETVCDQASNVLQGRSSGGDTAPAKIWDVVLLDPMFPRIAKKALPNRGLQHLRQLTEESLAGSLELEDELAELLALAKAQCSGRVVVKRRLKDDVTGQVDFQIKGKSVRFDVYLGAA